MKNFYLACFFIFVILASFIYIYYDIFKSIWIGIFEKKIFSRKLKKFAKHESYLFLNNVKLLLADNSIIKIDYLLFADRYIYIIANKVWLGELTGMVVDEKWLLYQGEKLLHVTNPIKQNEFYIKVLLNLIQASREDFYNIAVFPSTVHLDNIMMDSNQIILNSNKLIKFIKKNEKNKDVKKFKNAAIEEAANKILSYHNRTLKEE